MKPFTLFRFLKRWLAASALCGTILTASAHDPLDISSRVIVQDDSIEITSIAGLDVARAAFAKAGLSPTAIALSLKERGPDALIVQPAELASQIFAAEHDGRPLACTQVYSRAEGMEVEVKLTFPRPESGGVTVRAVYFETISTAKPGSLIVLSDHGRALGAMLLSPVQKQLRFVLPPKRTTSDPSPAR